MQCEQQHAILIHYNEIGLKGRNQPQFRRHLRQNIRLRLDSVGLDWPVKETPGYFTVAVPAAATAPSLELALQTLREVFGIAWIAPVQRLPHRGFSAQSEAEDQARLRERVLAIAAAQYTPGKTFCVRVKRAEKTLPFSSVELEARLGEVILENTKWDKVSLKQPDVTFQMEIRRDATYLFSEKLKGPGGLPVGTAGRVLVLLSGGIDSPVAAWLMAKRGCRVDFIHFTATSMQQDEARNYKVWRLARHLSRYTLGSRLFLVPYTNFDIALTRAPHRVDFDLVLFRRFMARVAEQLAHRLKAQALVSGDNLSQVASQTLANLVSTSRAAEMPILRPLVAFNKEEIIALAEQIGTYQESIAAYKDCCALISHHPKTRSQHGKLTELEQRLFPDYPKLIEQTLAEALCLEAPLAGAERESQKETKG